MPSKHQRGFTLVELLATIAIIGILAGILIPVTGKVRQNAKRVSCLSQIRQIGMGLFAFVYDNRKVGPYSARNLDDGTNNGNMDVSVWRYRNEPVQLGQTLPYLDVPGLPDATPSILICPGMSPERLSGMATSFSTGYRLNPSFTVQTLGKPPGVPFLDHPSRRVIIADCHNWWAPDTLSPPANHDAAGMNVFRLDGSAQWLPAQTTKGLPSWNWDSLDTL